MTLFVCMFADSLRLRYFMHIFTEGWVSPCGYDTLLVLSIVSLFAC